LIVSTLTAVILFALLGTSLGSVWLQQVDQKLLSIAGIRAEPGMSFFELVTVLGSDYVLGATILLTSFVLYRSAKTSELIAMIGVGTGAKLLEHGLKLVFHRARPELLGPTNQTLGDYSFPSGHSLNTVAIYGFMLFLIWSNMKQPLLKSVVLIIGVATIIVVGISRVVLKTHWPTDVAGGWLIGSILLLASVFVLSRLGPNDYLRYVDQS